MFLLRTMYRAQTILSLLLARSTGLGLLLRASI